MLAGAARIKVSFQVDPDGPLSVSAQETLTGVHAAVQVKPSYGLSEDSIRQMLEISIANADADMQWRLLREQQVETDGVIAALRAALRNDGQLLSETERGQLHLAIEALQAAKLVETDHVKLKNAIATLDKASAEFAGRRMDRSVQQALVGRNVDAM